MSGMTDYQRRHALRAVDNLLSYSISKMFSEPVDINEFPNYLEIISKPMDLGTIRRKVIQNEYSSTQEFKQDVQLVWENSNKFNGKQSIIAGLAKTLHNIFQAETEFLTGNDPVDWQNSCKKLAESVQIKLNIVVKSSSGSSSSGSSSSHSIAFEKRQSLRTSLRKQSSAQYDAAEFETEEIAVVEKPTRSDRKKITRASSASVAAQAPAATRKTQKKEVAAPIVEEEHIDIPLIEELPRYEDKPLTFEEQNQLVADIGKITGPENEFYEEQIIQCISDMQPELIKNNEVNISIDKLNDSTLIRLRKIVNDIMKHLSL